MFDDQEKTASQGQGGANGQNSNLKEPVSAETGNRLNGAIQDMFAESDKSEKPPVFQKMPDTLLPPAGAIGEKHGHQKVFFLIFLLSFLALLAVGAFFSYRYFAPRFLEEPLSGANQAPDNKINISEQTEKPDAPDKADEDTKELPADADEQADGAKAESANAANSTSTTDKLIDETNATSADSGEGSAVLDSDQDGLSDEEEWRLRTAVDNVDTDNDGLFDREEVKTHRTDPRNPDTDSDGFTDGQELKSGYNPLGPGKLFDNK